MNKTHATLAAAFVFAMFSVSGAAFAQAPSAAPAAAPVASDRTKSERSTAEQVEAWTRTQWEAAQKEWTKNEEKWADCRKQSSTQKLEGRKSWSFLYQCMTG